MIASGSLSAKVAKVSAMRSNTAVFFEIKRLWHWLGKKGDPYADPNEHITVGSYDKDMVYIQTIYGYREGNRVLPKPPRPSHRRTVAHFVRGPASGPTNPRLSRFANDNYLAAPAIENRCIIDAPNHGGAAAPTQPVNRTSSTRNTQGSYRPPHHPEYRPTALVARRRHAVTCAPIREEPTLPRPSSDVSGILSTSQFRPPIMEGGVLDSRPRRRLRGGDSVQDSAASNHTTMGNGNVASAGDLLPASTYQLARNSFFQPSNGPCQSIGRADLAECVPPVTMSPTWQGRCGNMAPPPAPAPCDRTAPTSSSRGGLGDLAGRRTLATMPPTWQGQFGNMGPPTTPALRNRTAPMSNRGMNDSNWNKTKADAQRLKRT